MVCDQYLRQTLCGIEPKVIDYNLGVAYFLEETNHLHLGPIPQSVDHILNNFDMLRPLTGRQNALHQCALHIKSTIAHHAGSAGDVKPFAL